MELDDVSFQFLQEITDGFSKERILGEGAFGVVYKGVTKNGQGVAVKKLKLRGDILDNEEFRNEIYNLRKLKHKNIVQILGYCYEIMNKPFIMPDGRMTFVQEIHAALCFNYFHNGSLQKYLSDEFSEFDWSTRFRIIKGICDGLKYIHMEQEKPIYHLDLKPDKIFLDWNMVPKIADLDLSTRSAYGTLGYQPPEYIEKGEISEKFDIFSLGVIMLRIVSGPKGYPKGYPECLVNSSDEFIDQVQKIWRNKLQATSITDFALEAYCHQVKICTQIALASVEEDKHKRPNIEYITKKLKEIEIYIIGQGIAMELDEVSFQFLQEITDGFSEERILRQGAFGVVYKGVTKNGDDVAVKKLPFGLFDYMQFRNEFYIHRKLKHKNIVQILGYCYEIKEEYCILPDGRKILAQDIQTALCFEYLHNGSLEKYLSDEFTELDWRTRFKIIKGICDGLKYIHMEQEKPIYHLDLKPDNILLDMNMVPKIADFDLSTTSAYGTRGYMPPEYIRKGEISEKFDIFSLGVIMLRIVSGSKSYLECPVDSSDDFIDQVQKIWRNKLQATSITDFALEAYCHQVKICTQIALASVEEDKHERPNIEYITKKLKEIEIDNIGRGIAMELDEVSFQFLQEITDGFSEERILRQGAFGVVYKGVTKNGDDVAVKKLPFGLFDYMQFRNEFYIHRKLKHKNIVQILGYCYEIKEESAILPDGRKISAQDIQTALCFEYLHNGSLEKYLSDEFTELDWRTRFKIIQGICDGLKYIHMEQEKPIYHLDLKPDNILLDMNMVPKIADFDLSTRSVYGTPRYQPPEYIEKGEISEKFDIFSLGVIMLRIVSGPKGYPECRINSSDEFIDQVQKIWRNKLQATSITDFALEAYCHQVKICTQIALASVEEDKHKRPNIEYITKKLKEIEIDNIGQEMMISSDGFTEAPVSSSLGAMGPLLRKLDLLLVPDQYPLWRPLKHAIVLLKEDLVEICDTLVEHSMGDSPNHKAKYWMQEVLELLYDVEDCIDAMTSSHTAADGRIVRHVHGYRVGGRFKIRRLDNMLKPSTGIVRIAELRTLLREAMERHERYQLDGCISKHRFVLSGRSSRVPLACEVVGNLVGIDGSRNELTTTKWLTDQADQQLKVLCIVGPAGVGKTTLAKKLYREPGGQFECRAFIRVSRNPDISRLLQALFYQIQQPKQNSKDVSVQGVIDNIRKHLQDKRYFIVIDDLWEPEAWDIIKIAFPKGNNCSRVIITGEVENIAAGCSGYHTVDIFELKPLGSQDSEKLFFDRALSSEDHYPGPLKDLSCRILKECGGLPLAIITVAALFASLRDNPDMWQTLMQFVLSSLENLSLEDMLKEIVDLCFNNLPQELKTCLQYLTMYPVGCTIQKDDLLKQWTAEGFITSTQGNEGVADSCFNELVKRGMLQPEKINYNNEVISCTVHHIVHDLITHKAREENFITTVDYSRTIAMFFMKARRLSLHYSCAQYATKPEGIMVSQVRSLAFFGLTRCMPSVIEFKLLRVLILEFWGNEDDDSTSINLSRICRLCLLRYLRISSHIYVELPSEIQGLKLLEILEIDARISVVPNEKVLETDARESAVPNDIVHLPGLLHLSLQDGTKLPNQIGLMTSLQTLKYFDLGNNSEDNVQSLGELINLRDLHLTCSTEVSHEHLKRNLITLGSSLGRLANLKSLTLAHGAVGMTMFVDHSSAMFSTPMFLQRLELPPICIFSRLPEWIGKLHKLCILKIAVRVLLKSDIDILTGLPDLGVLSLYVRQPNTECVVFNSGALPVLKYFKFRCSALCIAFREEALPNLRRLKVCFNVHRGQMYSHMISGVEHLLDLKEIAVRIGAADDVEESDRMAVESAFESAIQKHPRFPIYMNVKRVDWVE